MTTELSQLRHHDTTVAMPTSGDQSFDQRVRRAVIKFSILRVDEVLPDLRLRSMHNPEKKDNTISAIAEGGIVGFSATMFIARGRCNSARFTVTTPYASSGRIANSRIELTEKHPCCSPLLRGPFLRKVSTFFQPRGSLVRSPLFSWPLR